MRITTSMMSSRASRTSTGVPDRQPERQSSQVRSPESVCTSGGQHIARRFFLMILMLMRAMSRRRVSHKDPKHHYPHDRHPDQSLEKQIAHKSFAGKKSRRRPSPVNASSLSSSSLSSSSSATPSVSWSPASSVTFVFSRLSSCARVPVLILFFGTFLISSYECVSGLESATHSSFQTAAARVKGTVDPRVITYPGDVNFALIIDAHENVNRRPSSPSAAPNSPSFSTLNVNSTSGSVSPSYGPLDCSERVNSDGVLKGMAAIWAAHQVNIRKGKGERLRIGVSVYDSCSSAQVMQRQSVRLVASSIFAQSPPPSSSSSAASQSLHHLLPGLRNCGREAASKTQPLIFGVVMDTDSEETGAPALALFDSFSMPVVTTSQINQDTMNGNETIIDSSVFSVAPSLEYMSRGVMALLKRLNWSSATLVISDQVPASYSSVFEEIAKTVNFNVIATSPVRPKGSRNLRRRNSLQDFSIPESIKNTLLFLSTKESMQLFTSLKSNLPLPGNDKYNWILVTDSDITEKVRTIFSRNASSSSRTPCNTKAMFLFVPNTNVPTREFNKYFEHEIATYAGSSVHPLISQFSKQYLSPDPTNRTGDGVEFRSQGGSGSGPVKRKKLIITSSEGLSLSMKAVWTMATALKKIEDQHCVHPHNLTKAECLEKLKGLGMRELILNQTRHMNYDKVSGLGVAALDGFALKFNGQNILKTSRFSLKIVTSTCKVFDAGYYTEDTGLSINEVIFNTLKVESEATSQSAPTGTYKASTNYFILNPKVNRSLANLRSLKPPIIGPNGIFYPGIGINGSGRAAVMDRFENEPEDSEDNALNVTYTSLATGGNAGLKPGIEYETNSRSPAGDSDRMTSVLNDNPAKMANSRSSGVTSQSADAKSSGSRESMANLKRFRHVIRTSGSAMTLTSWLGRGWSMTILISSVIGALITLYTFTFLLMKFCEMEGTLGNGSSNSQSIVSITLFACIILFLGSMIFLFEASPVLCSIKSSVRNIGFCLLFGSLLIQSMFLRAQKTIGLGGNVSQVNQLLTLSFIIATQVSMESGSWKVLSEWSSSNIFTFSVYAMCAPSGHELLVQHSFLLCLLALLLLFAWGSRHEPVTSNDGANLLTAVSLSTPVFVSAIVLCQYFTESVADDVSRSSASHRDLISSLSMIIIAFVVLVTIFLPILYSIHKYDTTLSSSAMALFHRSAGGPGAGVTPMGLSVHHMSPSGSSGDHRDLRPILDNLSTSSTSTNNDSFLSPGGVSSNPTRRLLLAATSGSGGQVVGKGRKKDSRKGSAKSGQQAIFSPQTASYHYACNSPNCNFKMQHPVSSSSSSSAAGLMASGGRRFTATSVNPTTRSSSYPPTGVPHGISVTTGSSGGGGGGGGYHLPPTSSRFQSLFRPDGMIPASFSRFHSMHSIGKESEVPPTTNSTYHRLNPLFEQTEGSFRSAYP